MKRIAILVVMALLSLEVSARSVHYFTYSQAARTVSYLNAQNEMMIYFGYEYELPTYVLINEVWMERVNSSYYELWVYGWDAYTGDEIYMPLDLEGVWLFSSGHIYSAAQYLRFRVDVRTPGFTWHIPPYRPYSRVMHRAGYVRSYHYGIHRHGWMPSAYVAGPGMPPLLPPYYMRHPTAPAPMPTASWTPGTEKPVINTADATRDRNASTGTPVRSSHSSSASTSTSTNRTAGGTRGGSTTGKDDGSSTRSTTGTRDNSSSTRSTTGTRDNSGSSTRSTTGTRDNSGSSTRSTTGTRDNSGSSTRSTTPTRSTVESRSNSTSSRSNSGSSATSSRSSNSSSSATSSRSSNSSSSATSSRSNNSSSATSSRSSSASSSTNSSRTSSSNTRSSSATSGSRNSNSSSSSRSNNTRSTATTRSTR